MKITPIAQSSGAPGTDIGSISLGHTSPDRIAAAKAVLAGQDPVQARQAVQDKQVDRLQQNLKKIKMRTNLSPDRPITAEPAADQDPASLTPAQPAHSTISDGTEQTAEAEATKPLSPQFAALAKQKRALQLEAARLEKMKAELTGNSGIALDRLKSDPIGVLAEAGILGQQEFYDKMTKFILEGGNTVDPRIQQLQDKVDALEKGIDTKLTTRDEQAEENALDEMLYEAEELAKAGDTYQLIRDQNAYDQVLRKIYSHYKQTGRVLDVRSVMEEIETKLLEDRIKWAQHPKVQGKLTPQAAQAMQNAGGAQQQRQIRTLTNRDTAQPVLSRRERAMMAAQGLKR